MEKLTPLAALREEWEATKRSPVWNADWTDPSAIVVEWAWQQLGKPPLIAGHMHRSVVWENVRILDINEIFTFELAAR